MSQITNKPSDIILWSKWVLSIGIILCIISPFIFINSAISDKFNFTETGSIGDTIGGITSPFVSIMGSLLVFFALKAQIDANKLIQKQFDEQKADELTRKKLLYMTEQINVIRKDINDFTFTFRNNNYKYNYSGSDAINELFKNILKVDHENNSAELIDGNPKIFELLSLLKIFRKQIQLIKQENIPTYDKEYFLSLLEYQFNSKISQTINKFRKNKVSEQIICRGCDKRHGIPDEIFDECDLIIAEIN